MGRFYKVAIVVVAASVVGTGLGRLLADAYRMRGNARTNKPRPASVERQDHSTLKLDPINRGRPGQLDITGTFCVGVASKAPAGRDLHYQVSVTVADSDGNIMIDHDLIGQCHDLVGKAQWEQDFRAVYPLPPGVYRVEMFCYEPDRVLHLPDGSARPSGLRSTSRYTVR